MKLTIVVAHSANNVIGVGGELPWHLPEDLRRFRELTMGKPVIMGRATHESIGRPLPGRRNIVLSRQAGFQAAGCDVVASRDAALQLVKDADEAMIIGGGQIYESFLPEVSRIFRTRVDSVVAGDTYFPALDDAQWRVVSSDAFPADARRATGFVIEELLRTACDRASRR